MNLWCALVGGDRRPQTASSAYGASGAVSQLVEGGNSLNAHKW